MNSITKVEIISEKGNTKIKLNDGEPLKGVSKVEFKHNSATETPEITLTLEVGRFNS